MFVLSPRYYSLASFTVSAACLLSVLQGCNQDQNSEPTKNTQGTDFDCTAGSLSEDAYVPAGLATDGSIVLPNGRILRPVGKRLNLKQRFPLDVDVDPAARMVAVTVPGKDRLMVLSADLDAILTTYDMPVFIGLAFTRDGKRLYAGASAGGEVYEFKVQDDGIVPLRQIDIGGYVSGVALARNDGVLIAARNTDSKVIAMDLATGDTKEGTAGRWPYDLVLSPDGNEIYVSNWADSSVTVLNVDTMETSATIRVGKSPEGIAFEPGRSRAFVACADSDRIDVIDTARKVVTDRIDLTGDNGLLGSSPQHVVVDESGGRLYVTLGDRNLIEVISLYDLTRIGSIPTGQYPTVMSLSPDKQYLYVVESMGLGSDTQDNDPDGYVAKIPIPDLETLAEWTRTAEENNNARNAYYENQSCANVLPKEIEPGGSLPIEHVVLIVKENKTYDMVLGDLEGTNGDPELAIFGEKITPNTHALAKAFSNLDNYYSNPEVSIQGHLWTTYSDCNDFTEKARFNQLTMTGVAPEAKPPGGSVFDHLHALGIPFRNYGEVVGFGLESLGKFEDYIDKKYPFFNMGVPDVDKAAEVIREWEQGIFPRFVYISLPNDHTYGTKPGRPAPDYMVADNDEALGMLIETLSHSPYWEKTVVFVIEDDPQGIGDHVDAHRSICLVIGPWVKKGYVSHVHYDIPSVHATIERILGFGPMNRNDAEAPAMFDVFSDRMDPEPYTALPRNVDYKVNTWKTVMAQESSKLNFDKEDGAPGLGLILWRYMKGPDAPIPPQAKYIDE